MCEHGDWVYVNKKNQAFTEEIAKDVTFSIKIRKKRNVDREVFSVVMLGKGREEGEEKRRDEEK